MQPWLLSAVFLMLNLMPPALNSKVDSSGICCSGGDCLLKNLHNPDCQIPPICSCRNNPALEEEVKQKIKDYGVEEVCLPPDFKQNT